MGEVWIVSLCVTGYVVVGCVVGAITASREPEQDEAVMGAIVCLFLWPIVVIGFALWCLGTGLASIGRGAR